MTGNNWLCSLWCDDIDEQGQWEEELWIATRNTLRWLILVRISKTSNAVISRSVIKYSSCSVRTISASQRSPPFTCSLKRPWHNHLWKDCRNQNLGAGAFVIWFLVVLLGPRYKCQVPWHLCFVVTGEILTHFLFFADRRWNHASHVNASCAGEDKQTQSKNL